MTPKKYDFDCFSQWLKEFDKIEPVENNQFYWAEFTEVKTDKETEIYNMTDAGEHKLIDNLN